MQGHREWYRKPEESILYLATELKGAEWHWQRKPCQVAIQWLLHIHVIYVFLRRYRVAAWLAEVVAMAISWWPNVTIYLLASSDSFWSRRNITASQHKLALFPFASAKVHIEQIQGISLDTYSAHTHTHRLTHTHTCTHTHIRTHSRVEILAFFKERNTVYNGIVFDLSGWISDGWGNSDFSRWGFVVPALRCND